MSGRREENKIIVDSISILNKLTFFLLLLMLLFSQDSFAQKDLVRFRQITTNEGLSSNFINCFLQDDNGFMWIGTRGGLNRFDGNEFKIFLNDPDDSASISGNIIESIYQDKYGNLWIGTHSGLNIYDAESNVFTRLIHDPENPNSLSHNEVRSIIQYNDSVYWIATYGGGINKLNITFKPELSCKFTHFNNSADPQNYIPENNVNDLFIDSDNNLWAGLERDGIFKYSVDIQSFYIPEYLKNLKTQGNRVTVNMITEDQENNIWFGTWELGFFKIDKINKTVSNYNFDTHSDNLFYNYIARTLTFENNNTLWLGSFGGGLIKFDKDSEKLIRYVNDPLRNSSLGHNIVWNVYIDNSGTLWVGTWGAGISLLNLNRPKFYHYTHHPGDPGSLAGNTVNNIFTDYTGKIWISTFEAGINIFDYKRETFRNIRYDPTNPSGLTTNTIWATYVDPDEYGEIVWMATDVDFLKYMIKLDKIKRYKYHERDPNNKKNPGFTNIRYVTEDSYGMLWLATYGGGIDQFDRKNEIFTHYRHDPDDPGSISSNAIFSLFEDSYKNLWIATASSGVDLFDRDKQQFVHYSADPDDSTSLIGNSVLCIFESNLKKLWIGTSNGLSLYNREKDNFTSFTIEDGFPSNTINSIEEDDNNNLWISTDAGISCFNPEKGTIKNFDKYDGLNNTYIFNSSSSTKDGYLIFGGSEGLDIFKPEDITESRYTAPVVITSFKLNNQEVQIHKEYNGRVLLKKSIEETDKIVLSYKHKDISFDFASLHYPAPEKNIYKYQLEGYNEDWVYTNSSRRFAIFSNLAPGKYVFKVKGTNNDGVWNEKETSIQIIVSPPFWKTWWFITIVSAMVLSSFIILYYIRLRAILRHKNELENQVKQRTLEIQEQNEEIRNQAEFLIRQRDQISDQNKELELHRNNLEKMVQDRTQELFLAKEKAEESDRLKTAFLANMSHEIRTPMNSIIGFIQLLDEEDVSNTERLKFKELIHINSQMLLDVIDDILDIAKIESGELKLKMGLCSINELLSETYNTYNEHIKLKNNRDLSFTVDNISEELFLRTDKIRLKQVLNNLVDNAVKYTETGFIKLGCTRMDGQLQFYVSDSGIGLSKENIDVIFDRFRKIEDVTDKLYRGTGLGLSITKKIIEMLNGKIWVESELGKGSTFYFTLPYEPVEMNGDNEIKKATINYSIPDLSGKTILVAEDEDSNFIFLEKLLDFTKAKIIRANDGLEVVEIFQSGKNIDLVLMDIKMPDLDGVNAAMQIKSEKSTIPIVAQTAFAMKEDRSKYIDLGFDEYIPKPINKNELYNLLNQLLG